MACTAADAAVAREIFVQVVCRVAFWPSFTGVTEDASGVSRGDGADGSALPASLAGCSAEKKLPVRPNGSVQFPIRCLSWGKYTGNIIDVHTRFKSASRAIRQAETGIALDALANA